MKTTYILSAMGLFVIMMACKKDDPKTFTPTDTTGTTVVKGNVNKNVVTPDGSGGWTDASTARVPAQGVHISITVNKSSLYPNSSAQGADVYSATTDANGNYSIPVKSNATGVTAMITIEGFTGTLDTLVNGQTRAGLSAVFQGTNLTTTLVMGQTQEVDHSFDSRNVSSNPNSIQAGNATVTGSVSVSLIKETKLDSVTTVYGSVNVPVEQGHKIYLKLDKDPISQTQKVYETTTDAKGYYTFTLSTVAPGTSGFNQTGTIWINDFASTRDTLKANNTRILGKPGVFKMSTTIENNLFNNTIRNAVYVRYTTFIPD
jgi:hypothetical protein